MVVITTVETKIVTTPGGDVDNCYRGLAPIVDMAMLLLPTLWYYDTRDDDDDDDEDDHRRTITKSILALPIITLVFNDSCIPSTVVLVIVLLLSSCA